MEMMTTTMTRNPTKGNPMEDQATRIREAPESPIPQELPEETETEGTE